MMDVGRKFVNNVHRVDGHGTGRTDVIRKQFRPGPETAVAVTQWSNTPRSRTRYRYVSVITVISDTYNVRVFFFKLFLP